MRMPAPLFPVAVLAATLPASALAEPDAAAGRYRAAAGPELASELVLTPDGRFTYWLSVGALDERAAGRWIRDGAAIRLVTEPTPVPPTLTPGSTGRTDEAPLTVRVVTPQGRGVPGVDLTVGFDEGDPVEDYTQADGWRLPADERREPRWIELREPIYGIDSGRIPIDPARGNALTILLTINELGVYDFRGSRIELTPGGLVLHRGDAMLRYVAVQSR